MPFVAKVGDIWKRHHDMTPPEDMLIIMLLEHHEFNCYWDCLIIYDTTGGKKPGVPHKYVVGDSALQWSYEFIARAEEE